MTEEIRNQTPPDPKGDGAASSDQALTQFKEVVAESRLANGFRPLLRWLAHRTDPGDRISAWEWLRACPTVFFWSVATFVLLRRQQQAAVPDPMEWLQDLMLAESQAVAKPLYGAIDSYLSGSVNWEQFYETVRHQRAVYIKRTPLGAKKDERSLAFAASYLIATLARLDDPRWVELLLAAALAQSRGRDVTTKPMLEELLSAGLQILAKSSTGQAAVLLAEPFFTAARQAHDVQRRRQVHMDELNESLAALVPRLRAAEAETSVLKEQVAALESERADLAGRLAEAERQYEVHERVWGDRLQGERRGLAEKMRRAVGQDADEIQGALQAIGSGGEDIIRSRVTSIRRFLEQLEV